FMLWGPTTFALVPGQQNYTLHQEFLRPFYFINKSKNGQYLVEIPARELVQTDVNWNTDQDGRHFRWGGRQQVQTQPPTASVLTIVSTSGNDTGVTKAIIIYGETPDGLATESITPNGLTPVSGQTQ